MYTAQTLGGQIGPVMEVVFNHAQATDDLVTVHNLLPPRDSERAKGGSIAIYIRIDSIVDSATR